MDSIKELSIQQLYIFNNIVEKYEQQGIKALSDMLKREIDKRRKNNLISMNGCIDDQLTDQQLSYFYAIVEEFLVKGIVPLSIALKNEIKERFTKPSTNTNQQPQVSYTIRVGLFEIFELVVLIENNICSMQDLVEANLDDLKLHGEPIPVHVRESLRFKRQYFSNSNSNGVKVQQVESGHQFFKKPGELK